jgi:hypothetical protein
VRYSFIRSRSSMVWVLLSVLHCPGFAGGSESQFAISPSCWECDL